VDKEGPEQPLITASHKCNYLAKKTQYGYEAAHPIHQTTAMQKGKAKTSLLHIFHLKSQAATLYTADTEYLIQLLFDLH